MQKLQSNYGGLETIWRRQMGELTPIGFARKIGGSQDLIQRLQLYSNLDGHDGCVNTVHFNPSGELLVSGSDDLEIIIWDWAARLKKYSFNSGHVNNVFQAKVMPFTDDRCIVSCGADGQVRLAEFLDNGDVATKQLAQHKGRAHKLAIDPGSSRIFLSSGDDGAIRHFDLREGNSRILFKCHSFRGSSRSKRITVRLNAITINPRNPNYFAVGGSDEYARVYDIRKVQWDETNAAGQPMDTFVPKHLLGHGQVHITCLTYSHQEELLVSYNDELIYLFNKTMGLGSNPQVTVNAEVEDSMEVPQVYKGHRNARTVKGVSFLGPNSEYVVSGSDCGRIFIWKKLGADLVTLLTGDKQVVNCLEPHPHATILATSGIENTVKIWIPNAQQPIPLPSDAQKVMEQNQLRREDHSHISLTPDIIMHVLRLQRRQAQPDLDRTYTRADYKTDDEDNDESDEYMEVHFLDDEDSSEEGNGINLRECVIS
eukprot:c23470_g1_i1 orf=149-1600(+)